MEVRDESQAVEIRERLHGALEAPFDLDGVRVTMGASIGFATGSGADADADRLVRDADLAMYRAKTPAA